MTAQEKAKSLVQKFKKQISSWDYYHDTDDSVEQLRKAKLSAIDCVNEIDEAIDFDWMEVQNLDRVHKYWDDVRSEILKIAST